MSQPDEVYRNGRGAVHVLKRVDEEYFLVATCEPTNNQGLVRTAYLTNVKERKDRRDT